MLYVIIDAIVEAVLGAARWVMRTLRSAFVSAAPEAATTTGEQLSSDSKDRRRARRQLKRMGRAGDVEGLVRVYHRCGRGEHNRDLRIDALRQLARADRDAAEPLLREVIEGAEDAWVVTAAMEWAAKYRIVGVRDAVTAAGNDPRPAVAAQAATVGKRLERSASRSKPSAASAG